jgi:acyl dehydratase
MGTVMGTAMGTAVPIGVLAPGYALPPSAPETVTRERILAYAGASGDFNPMHVDEVTNTEAGMGGVFAHGMLGTAFLGRLVTDHLGDVPLASLRVRCTEVVRPGDVLSCTGRVVERRIEGATAHIAFALRAVNQRGELTHDGTASVALPLDELDQHTGDALDAAQPLVQWRAIG